MKNNWKKQYSLQELSLDKDFSEAVRKKVREKMNHDMQKGNIIMNVKKKRRTAVICAAAVALLSVSAIGIHAAASTNLWKEIKLWIDGEEFTASISQSGDSFYCEMINGEESDLVDIGETIETTFYSFSDDDTEFYTECDGENHLWLKATADSDFAIDVTDELVKNGSYTVTCIFANGNTEAVTVKGTTEAPVLTVESIETDTVTSVDIPLE